MPAAFDLSWPDRQSGVADLPETPAAPTAETMNVLIIEDDPAIVEMLTYTLANRGYRCASFADGRDALEQLANGPRRTPPPVVLVNIDMPGLGRVGAIERLERAHEEGFRILALTRTGSEREHVRALNAGALDYFIKPISLPVLTAKIIRLLWDHRRQ
jgi:two-component system phosphate regulon response regulator PhoB